MKQQNIERYKFEFIYLNVKFDVLYFIDDVPHKLAFGIKDHNYYFEIPVRKFEIKPFIDELNKFCNIMGFEYNPNSHYKPILFFNELNKYIPKVANKNNIPNPSQIAIYRNNVEESDKIYFIGWFENNKVGKNVRPKNLEKTRSLLSKDAYIMCRAKNISSCWSPNPKEEIQFKLPN